MAVDPFNPNHVVVTQSDGQLDESFNSGSSWSGWSQQPTDCRERYSLSGHFWHRNADGLAFDPATPGVLYINGDRSFWTTTLSGNITTSTVPTWTDQGIGIEQLCANEIIVAPVANSTPLVASWDTAVIAPNGSTYASTFGPVANGAVVAGWSIDYASSDPNFIVVLADGGYAGGPQESGYSTNDGQTWTPFQPFPLGEVSEVTLRRARRKTSFLPLRMEFNPTTRSMAERPGIRFLFREFPAGPILWEPTLMTTRSSQRTVCCRTHFICCLTASAFSKQQTAELPGR